MVYKYLKLKICSGNNIYHEYQNMGYEIDYIEHYIEGRIENIKSSNDFSDYFKKVIIEEKDYYLYDVKLLDSRDEEIFYIRASFDFKYEDNLETKDIIIVLNTYNGNLDFFYFNDSPTNKPMTIELDLNSLETNRLICDIQ